MIFQILINHDTMFRKPKRRNANQRQTVEGSESIDAIEESTQPIADKVKKEVEISRPTKSVLTFGDEEEEESLISSKNPFASKSAVRSNLQSVHKVRKRKEKSKISVSRETNNVPIKQEPIEPNGGFKSR